MDLRGASLAKRTPELLPKDLFKKIKKDDLCVNKMLVYSTVLQLYVPSFIALLGYNSYIIDTHDIEDTEDIGNTDYMDNKDNNTHSTRFYKQLP